MWYLNFFEAENFFSHKSVRYEIINNKLTMIYGKNLDVSERKSNGSGKSVILDIINFSITGDCLRKVKSLKEIINNESESCSTIIELSNTFLKSKLKIKRSLFEKKSQKIEIYLNDIFQDQFADLHPRESDKFIEDQLGISFEDLSNYYLISKFKYQSLFLANDSTKKEVINRFSKADIIDDVFPHINLDIEKEKSKYQEYNDSLIQTKTKIKLLEEQIEDIINENNEESKKIKIEQIEKEINIKKSLILDIKNKISDLKSEKLKFIEKIKILEKDLISQSDLDKYNSTELECQLEMARVEYKNVRLEFKNELLLFDNSELSQKNLLIESECEIKEYNEFIKDIENHLAGEIECPKCSHKFILADKTYNLEEAKESLNEIKKIKIDTEQKTNEISDSLKNIKLNRQIVENQIVDKQKILQIEAQKIKEDIDRIEKLKSDLIKSNNALQSNILENKRNIESNESILSRNLDVIESENKRIEFLNQDIDELKKDKSQQIIKDINNKIEDLVQIEESIKNHLDTSNLQIQRLNEWQNKFKRFKSFLANQSIGQIQSQANYFLNKMKSDLSIFIDGFRLLSNGKIKEEITVELSRDGLNGESFGKFSGGEKSTADLSSILSMQNIINSTSYSGGLNFLGIDEILESVDESGMNDISLCLNNLNQTILIIAHSMPSQYLDCNKFLVVKKNGISKIEKV